MVVKPVLLFLLSQLLLSLVTFKVNAEESILLIDKSQGIDNTIDPTIKQLNDINQSLKDILPSDEALPYSEFESESLNEITPSDEALPDDRPGRCGGSLPVGEPGGRKPGEPGAARAPACLPG